MSEPSNRTASPGTASTYEWRDGEVRPVWTFNGYQHLIDALRLLHADEHEAGDDESYEAFLVGNYAGCASCEAAFIIRAAAEGRAYPTPNWSVYREEFAARPLPDMLALPVPNAGPVSPPEETPNE